MPNQTLSNFLFLPELHLTKIVSPHRGVGFYYLEKCSEFEVCCKCASKSSSVYDKRQIKIRDEPIRRKQVVLLITKRRFWCRTCCKPFTEPIAGISKGHRTTARYKRALLWACENFSDLSKVKKHFHCSPATVQKACYQELKNKQKQRQHPLPKALGLDEHSIHKPKYKATEYATIVVDHTHKKVLELINGRDQGSLQQGFEKFSGQENIKFVTMDLSSTYRKFARDHFPKAQIIADRFHVHRLFSKALNKERKKITGDQRKNPIRKLVLRKANTLERIEYRALLQWMNHHPKLRELYEYKEAMNRFYEIKGIERAKLALIRLLDRMGRSTQEVVQNLRKVLLNWRNEILGYFINGLSNGRVEGFNRKAKLLQRKAYGYSKFENYRLRLLHECCGKASRRLPTIK